MRPFKKSYSLLLLLGMTLTLAVAQQTTLRGRDVRFVATPQSVVEQMLKLADVKPDDLVYDLGCGDGRVVITAAEQYRARAVGIDIDPERITKSMENARQAGVEDRVSFRNEDLFEADIREATVVTLYLLRGDRVRVMPLGPSGAPRAGGTAQTSRAGVFVAGRPWQRGKNGSSRPPGTHTPRCRVSRDGEIPASPAPHIG